MTALNRSLACAGRALVAAWMLAMLSQPGLAQITVGGPEVVAPAPMEVEGSRLVVDFPVTAGPATGMQLVLPRTMEPVEGTAPLPLRWSRADSGAAEVAGVPVAIAPGATVTFRMETDLPDTRRHAVRLILRRAGAAGGGDRILGPYVFSRAPVPLPKDFLLSTLHQTVTIWPWLPATAQGAGTGLRLAIRGANATARPVAVAGIAHGALVREGAAAGTTSFSYPVSAVTSGHTCGDKVAPGGFCTVELLLPGLLRPGRYGLDVALSGAEGGVSPSRVTLEVRAPGWFAALLVALGALVGAAIAHWREVDRPRALVELPLIRIADGFRDLANDADSREVKIVARDRVAEIETALSESRLGRTAPAADAAALSAALKVLRGVERGIAAVLASGTAAQPVKDALAALNASLRADPWEAAATAAALARLEQALAADRPLIRLEEVAARAQIDLTPGQTLPDPTADAATYVRRITRMDLGTALFMAALIGLVGLPVLWVGDPVWGSALDIVAAFAAGVATRLTLPSPVAKPFG